jgi:3',5'-cyclic-nucleotide phosphodiesterase/cAMP-specific phosphodiesterase 4
MEVVNDEIKRIYTQTIGSSSSFQSLFYKYPQMKRIRSMMEFKEQLANILEGLGEWDFDTLAISEHAQNPCFEVGFYVFIILGLSELFDISNQKLRNFLTAVEAGYHNNYYHNSFHAADVTSSTVFLIINGLGFTGKVSNIDIFGLVVAALCHDVGHPGLNNSFLIAREDEYAMIYNDKSVLENMHAYRTFQILRSKSCNIHSKLSQTDFKAFRKIVVDSIIATDLSLHFYKINQLREGLYDDKTLEDEAFKHLALQLTLKCADLGHGAKSIEIHKRWTELITEEFFKQGDTERELGMTVNPLFDRGKVSISESQIGFINVLVKPLFDVYEEFVKHFTDEEDVDLKIEVCSRNILNNLEYWENLSEK